MNDSSNPRAAHTFAVPVAALALALLCTAAPASADLKLSVGRKARPSSAGEAPAALSPDAPAQESAAPRVTPLFGSPRPRQLGVRRRRTPPILPSVTGATRPEAPPDGDAEQVEVNARLGKLLGSADAYRLPTPSSQHMARIKQGTQVAIVSQWDGWYAIIMRDGSQAYVPKTHVEVLPFMVKTIAAPAQPSAPRMPPSRSNPTILPTLSSRGSLGRGTLRAMARVFEPAPNAFVQRQIEEAFRYEGVRYVYGGNGFSGVDCSGLVRTCFKALGVDLPRRASEQARVGIEAPLDALQPGDRLYFSGRHTHDHTGIYLGNGYFIHAGSSRGNVGVDHLSMPYFKRTLSCARRF